MYIVIYQAKGDLNIQRKHYGPFYLFEHAEDWLASLPAASECECKYIEELITPDYGDKVKGATL